MNKATDFSIIISEYFVKYLAERRNLSNNTIQSYRDTFYLLLLFMQEQHNCPPQKIKLSMIDSDIVEEFLNWLESERHNSISTRNQRLAAIHAFFRFVQFKMPEMLIHCQNILAVELKKCSKSIVPYLSEEELKELLSRPDSSTKYGRRDQAILCLLYDSGARVQELIDLSACDINLKTPATIRLVGKGRKSRIIPLMKQTAAIMKKYMAEWELDPYRTPDSPMFVNHQNKRFTRPGISYILKKYMQEVYEDNKSITQDISPHMLRHTKAMHLLRAGVNLYYIRDFLGHVNIVTTEVYARADTEMKRAAIEKANPDIIPNAETSWQKDKDLMSWLMKLGE